MRVGRAGGVGMVILLLWGGGGPGPSGSVLLGSTHSPAALSEAHAPAAKDLADRYVAAIEEVVVRPRKSDIQVSGLKLAWKPD